MFMSKILKSHGLFFSNVNLRSGKTFRILFSFILGLLPQSFYKGVGKKFRLKIKSLESLETLVI